MARLLFQNLADYHAHVKNRIAVSQVSNDWTAVRRLQINRREGSIAARPLHFIDGAILRFNEEVIIIDDQVDTRKTK